MIFSSLQIVFSSRQKNAEVRRASQVNTAGKEMLRVGVGGQEVRHR